MGVALYTQIDIPQTLHITQCQHSTSAAFCDSFSLESRVLSVFSFQDPLATLRPSTTPRHHTGSPPTSPLHLPLPPNTSAHLCLPLKGALLRGVQLFNDRMLSRWRAEGFLDLATTPSTTLSSSTRIPSRRKGRGSNILRKILALDDNIDGDDDDYDKSHRAGSGVVGVSERGIESRGRLPDVITNADTTLPVVGTTNTEEQHKNEGLVEGIGCRERAIVVATAAGIVSSSAAPVGRQQH